MKIDVEMGETNMALKSAGPFSGSNEQNIAPKLRVIGDVHGQFESSDLFTPDATSYLEIIADARFSVQLGDMGNRESYERLIARVDAARHQFFPGNHEQYDWLPPHSLGDFGSVLLGGVEFFFVRGAWSSDRAKLIQLGQEQGKTIWFEQEELTKEQMDTALDEYLRVRPRIVLSHDAPTHVARYAWQNARRFSAPNPSAVFRASRTTDFLERLLEHHQPRLWLFGHHHRDWRRKEGQTLFVCVGELSYVDIDSTGNVHSQ